MRLQLIIILKKSSFYRFFVHKTRTNTQQELPVPVQIGLYRYDEQMAQKINNENLFVS